MTAILAVLIKTKTSQNRCKIEYGQECTNLSYHRSITIIIFVRIFNSVKYSSTMRARRFFEILNAGSFPVSNFSISLSEYGAYSIISDDKSVVDQALKKISSKNRMKRISAAQVNIGAWHGYRDFCRGLCDKIGIETQKICVSAKKRLPSSWKAIEKEFRFISGSEAQIEVLSWPNSNVHSGREARNDLPYEIIDFNSGDTIKGLSNAIDSVRRIKGNTNTAISLPNEVGVFKPIIEFPKLREQEFFEEAKGIRQFRLNDDRQIYISNYRSINAVVVSKRLMLENQNKDPKKLLFFKLNFQ